MKTITTTIAALGIILSSCGGTNVPPPPSAAQGLWCGTTNTDRSVISLILSDGLFYVLYSSVGDPDTIAGVIQGNGTTNGNSFSSSNAKDFNLEGGGVIDATVSANFSARKTLNGTVSYTSYRGSTLTSTYRADYELTPSVPALAGTFTGQVASSVGVENATVTLARNGTLSGSGESGCALTGSVTPRTDGNAFATSITFGGPPCYFENQTFTGTSYFDATTRRLYSVTPNPDRSDGILFVGTKP